MTLALLYFILLIALIFKLPEVSPYNVLLKIQERRIKDELKNYTLPLNTTLKKLTLATGGQPIRTVIISAGRTGSNFLGDIIGSLPGTIYHYEPLFKYDLQTSKRKHEILKNLLNCNYTNLQDFLKYPAYREYSECNKSLWWARKLFPQQYCWNQTFMNQLCSLFPFHSIKTIRIRVNQSEKLLQDKNMNVKIIFLARDPRGTINSRKGVQWQTENTSLCSNLVSDYNAAARLQGNYPSRIKAIRYEDLSLNPHNGTKELYDFIGLNVPKEVKAFINSHTTINRGYAYSTYRNSKNAPFHWKADLNYTEIQHIEDNCEEAMKLWGYMRIKSPNLTEFNPLGPYEIRRNS